MIVCLCTGATDRDVRTAIEKGARTEAQVTRACGAGSDCGSCTEMVKQMLCSRPCAGGPSAGALLKENQDK